MPARHGIKGGRHPPGCRRSGFNDLISATSFSSLPWLRPATAQLRSVGRLVVMCSAVYFPVYPVQVSGTPREEVRSSKLPVAPNTTKSYWRPCWWKGIFVRIKLGESSCCGGERSDSSPVTQVKMFHEATQRTPEVTLQCGITEA